MDTPWEPAPVRRPRAFRSDAFEGIDFSAIDMVSIDEALARIRRPAARLPQLVRRPRPALQARRDQRRVRRQRIDRG